MTRAMAAAFGEVHAVDISAEMIAAARRNLSDLPNVRLHKNNGFDLAELPDQSYDLAFSFIVFQHIPIPEAIENYVRDVYRCLKPGAVFKFQVQGDTSIRSAVDDTWVGAPLSLAGASALAERCGFELLDAIGAGTQYFWLWFRKPKRPWIPRALRQALRNLWTRTRSAVEKRVEIGFEPRSVRAGESYVVSLPRFAGQMIDIGFSLVAGDNHAPIAGVVARWCALDSQGRATITVPADHPTGTVWITRVRSRTRGGRWHPAQAAIHVSGAEHPPAGNPANSPSV